MIVVMRTIIDVMVVVVVVVVVMVMIMIIFPSHYYRQAGWSAQYGGSVLGPVRGTAGGLYCPERGNLLAQKRRRKDAAHAPLKVRPLHGSQGCLKFHFQGLWNIVRYFRWALEQEWGRAYKCVGTNVQWKISMKLEQTDGRAANKVLLNFSCI